MTALEIGQMIKDKKTSAEEVTKSMLDTIKAKESNINAFTNVFEESAMKNAAEVQAKIESGELLLLLPVYLWVLRTIFVQKV